MKIKVFLADDHHIVRQGLKALVERENDFTVIGEAENGLVAVKRVNELLPDVVVMDLHMPDLNGVEATRQVLAENPHIKVVCLTAHADRRATAEMLRAGARGFVLKDAAFEELIIAVRMVMKHKVYLSPAMTGLLVDDVLSAEGEDTVRRAPAVSMREREVLRLIADGSSTKEIAMQLHLSTKTIESHRRNLMEKLKIDSVAALTKYAIREGLTRL